ncbi:hypothetical protein COJ85_07395 [Bacillus sp. AFS076308]|nr:hypothetical protein COJ85_07395 [Bacillus sp. AFS076308]PGV52733.1 hypothetical protein COD92_08530 [Bacillus sp. AFS037270]
MDSIHLNKNNGCICCTVLGDLSSTLLNIYHQVKPDIIIIEFIQRLQ